MNALQRCAVAALAFVLLAVANPAAGGDASYVRPQRLVDVGGGRTMNLYCSGRGAPTIILDAGLGSSMYTWKLVQSALTNVRVCSYDRAGYGFSDPSSAPHTSSANVDDLHRMLQTAGIPGPYVIVAHSLNAFDARLYADRYPRNVAGVLLIDPSDVEEERFSTIYGKGAMDAEQSADAAFLKHCDALAHEHRLKSGDACTGAPNPAESAALRAVSLRHVTSAAMWDAVLSEFQSVPTDIREVTAEQRSYGSLSLIVLTAGAVEEQGAKAAGLSPQKIAAAVQLREQMRENDAHLSDFGIACTIPGAGHYLQNERPSVVVAAIRELVRSSELQTHPRCGN